jgi:NitT/TauT family transport system permease protein
MLLSGEIAHNIVVSVGRAGAGFLIAAVLGVAAGVASARVRVLQHLTEPLLHGFRAIPVIALVPLSVLWFGIGETAKVALVATGAFFPIWIATFIGVRDVHIVYLRSAACLGAGRLATMVWVILPAALPFILTGLRQAMAISLIVLVAAELSGATAGVAYMMSMGHQLFRVDVMFIGLLLLGTLGFVFDRLFVLLTQRLFPWYTTAN